MARQSLINRLKSLEKGIENLRTTTMKKTTRTSGEFTVMTFTTDLNDSVSVNIKHTETDISLCWINRRTIGIRISWHSFAEMKPGEAESMARALRLAVRIAKKLEVGQ